MGVLEFESQGARHMAMLVKCDNKRPDPVVDFLSGEISASLNGQVETQNCGGKGACWGGGGAVEISGAIGGGAIIRDGSIILLQATVSGKSGAQGSVVMNCQKGEVKGQWSGVTIPVVLEFYDGFIHFDFEYQLIQPEPIDPYEFPLPNPTSLF